MRDKSGVSQESHRALLFDVDDERVARLPPDEKRHHAIGAGARALHDAFIAVDPHHRGSIALPCDAYVCRTSSASRSWRLRRRGAWPTARCSAGYPPRGRSPPAAASASRSSSNSSRPFCSGCGRRARPYDRLEERRFEFVPIWGIVVFWAYRMRRVDCKRCGVTVEMVPTTPSGERTAHSHGSGAGWRVAGVVRKLIGSSASAGAGEPGASAPGG